MSTLILVLILCVFLPMPCSADGPYYVDNAASGSNNGSSWTNAWQSLASINWGSVASGDNRTIYISGDPDSGTTYNEALNTGADGSEGNPIVVAVGQDEGHNGLVVIDGTGKNSNGLVIDQSYIKISGQVGSSDNCSIVVQNAFYNGVSISGSITNFELAYIDITQNNSNKGASSGIKIFPTESNSLSGIVRNCKIHNQIYGDDIWVVMTYTGDVDQFDTLRIYDNDIYDFHADAVKMLGEGVSFYNNTIRDRGTFISDHPDGIQAYSGYLKIYNNTFHGFHRNDDNNVNSYIRYNPDGMTGRNPRPKYVYIYNNLFYETLPLVFAGASVVTNNGNTYTCKVGHYSTAAREPGVGASWETYWTQTGSGGDPWLVDTAYSQKENVRRGVELAFGDPTLAGIDSVYFMNNTIAGSNYFGLFVGFRYLDTTDVSNIQIANNIFFNAAMIGGNYGSNAVMLLVFDDNDTVTFGKWGDDVDVVVDYNVVCASTESWSTSQSYDGVVYSWTNFLAASGTSANPSNATQDPVLSGSYALSASSPYRDAGIDLSTYFTTDILGNPRGATWDIGAYEYVPLTSTSNASGSFNLR